MPKSNMPKAADVVAGGPSPEEQLAAAQAMEQQPVWDDTPAHPELPTEEVEEPIETVDEPQVVEEPPTRKSLKERLGDLEDEELEELFKVSKIKERVAQQIERDAQARAEELERQNRERIAREEQDKKQREDEEYLRRLRKTDLAKYNEEMDKRDALTDAQREEIEQIRKVTNEFTRRLGVYVDKNIEKDIANQLRSKDYTHLDLIDGIITYIDDIVQARTESGRKAVEKELRPVLKKQLLTEINSKNSPQPSTGPVQPKPQSDIPNFDTEEEVAQAFADGLDGKPGGITKDQLLAWYRTHGVPKSNVR